SNTITEGDASSNLAIAEAARIIARGKADVMITGGADSKIHPLSFVRLALHHNMSHWRGEPAGACRPFDLRRDGTVPGEGAGILILEEREHALRRGAVIHGELLGAGSGSDAMPGGGLDPQGIHRYPGVGLWRCGVDRQPDRSQSRIYPPGAQL